ncbi:hypothetical protein GCK72_004127 [Caenorhabditis remanei]|uniref:Uncharacterized protein n=1 Tax=Caenorhabditis remanei TaxID=31234 RepID=A0A6A5H8K6_CAERE|nr:hypothetical protein GCK72_004127 [Caenorhabditis remanei]KAF1764180.1 hypothetical protein GCK72_004127 [Caenorhabditis remanei]
MATSRPQPLFYQSSKCVALYLDANIRFQLSLRCPGFQTIHNNQTLRINDLKMRPNDFEINGTVYCVSVIQRYTDTPTPESVKLRNASGGFPHDVDKYGLREEGRIQDATKVKELEEKLKLMVGDRGLDLAIEQKKLEISAYRLRMSNQEPPFTHDLQLALRNGTVQKVEHVAYDKNLKFTRDYILGRIFGVAKRKVQIKDLHIGHDDFDLHQMFYLRMAADEEDRDVPQEDGPYNAFQIKRCEDQMEPLLPVPKGKLEIGEMRVTGNLKNALASIKASLSVSNPPLKKITCPYQPLPDDPVLQNTEFLCVAGIGSLKVFNGRLNNRIHLAECDVMAAGVTDLLNICTKVGQFYSIGFQFQTPIEEFFEMFRNLPGVETGESDESRLSMYRECLIVPMTDEIELNTWVDKTNDEDKEYCDTRFIVKVIVQKRGHAQVKQFF